MRKWSTELNGHAIVALLNEKGSLSPRQLQREIADICGPYVSTAMPLWNALWMLIRDGLIEVYRRGKLVTATDRNIAYKLIGELWHCDDENLFLLKASGVWVSQKICENTDFLNLESTTQSSVICKPIFGRAGRASLADVFVIMPFADEFSGVYDCIKSAIEGIGLSCARADELKSIGVVMSKVWSEIYECGVVIADCSGRNPNVFYELGVAHTVGKKCVILTHDAEAPFDIRHMEYIRYHRSEMEKLSENLRTVFAGLLPPGWELGGH